MGTGVSEPEGTGDMFPPLTGEGGQAIYDICTPVLET